MTKRAVQAAILACVLVAAGCTCAPRRDVPTVTAQTATLLPTATLDTQPTAPSSTTSALAAPTAEPPAEPTGMPGADYLGTKKQGGALGGTWTLTDVRLGAHEDRFRVVIEMAESRDRAPFHEAIEVDNAAVPFPSGSDPGWGAARIDLIVSDLYLFAFPAGERLPIAAPENPIVTRVDRYPTESDAHIGFSIGLREPAAYEVYYLTEPVRIVVDVLYP